MGLSDPLPAPPYPHHILGGCGPDCRSGDPSRDRSVGSRRMSSAIGPLQERFPALGIWLWLRPGPAVSFAPRSCDTARRRFPGSASGLLPLIDCTQRSARFRCYSFAEAPSDSCVVAQPQQFIRTEPVASRRSTVLLAQQHQLAIGPLRVGLIPVLGRALQEAGYES